MEKEKINENQKESAKNASSITQSDLAYFFDAAAAYEKLSARMKKVKEYPTKENLSKLKAADIMQKDAAKENKFQANKNIRAFSSLWSKIFPVTKEEEQKVTTSFEHKH